MNKTTAHVLGLTESPWRDAAPANPEAELVPYLRQLAKRLSSDLKVRKEDLAYWQAADRIEELSAALKRAQPALWLLATSGNPDAVAIHSEAVDALARARGEGTI